MAHELDMSNNRANMAFVGETPWHGLGFQLTAGADMDVWRREAGLDYEVQRAIVQYARDIPSDVLGAPLLSEMPDRNVLYRSDTGAALSVVSKDYRVVQPGEVLDFFGQLAKIGGFEMETAGALYDGKRIWALAKVNDGAPVIGHDVVRPYVLLATSYDGSMATTAKFTSIRVVCNNTLTMSVGSELRPSNEVDTEGLAVSSIVRVPHSAQFRPDEVRKQLGIVSNTWERWLVNTKIMAERELKQDNAEQFLVQLLAPTMTKPAAGRVVDVRTTRGYQRVLSLFNGGAIGAELTGGNTRWAMANAVSEFVDHERGRTDNSRLHSAWFGAGEGIKNSAYRMLASADEFKPLAIAA